jgi:hypothetical protein
MRWIFLFLLVLPYFLYADFVDSTKSKKISEIFYQKQFYKFHKTIVTSKVIQTIPIVFKNQTCFYINKMYPKGFVITTANDEAFPIFGYSFENDIDFNNLPENFIEYIQLASTQIINIPKNNSKENYKYLWKDIEHTPLNKIDFSTNTISPLLNLKWDQGVPYNNQCPPHPRGPGGRCLTGCVATAMAMVMKYHNYPVNGKGTKTFYWTSWDTIDFENTYYRWNQMTPVANSQSANAIAELMYHCGVSVNMNYGPTASGSYTFWVPGAMKNYFRYHPQIRYLRREQMFDYEWDMLIRDELRYKRPIIYSGSGTGGHAFVCDGFQDTCFYHFNWGWSGYANGYYYYNDLTPGNNNFTYGQGAVVYIMPYFGKYCVENFLYNDTARSINDGSGISYYWNNTSCSWIIKPKNNKNVTLYFNMFNTEPNNDVLYVYDGQNDQAPLIGAFSGNTLPPVITSTNNSLFLKFITNDTIQGHGWEAYYTTSYVGIENNENITNINIYPNPCDEYLYIENVQQKIKQIEIYNSYGKKINFYYNTCQNQLNTSHLPNGIYYIKIYAGQQVYIKKFCILR